MRKALFLVLAAAAGCAFAQQYRWIDDKGRVQYTDTPPPKSATGVQKKNLSPGPAAKGAEPYVLQVARKNFPVKLWTSLECAGCTEARNYLNQRGVPFTEISVTDNAGVEELKKVSGSTGVPVMQVGANIEKGFETGAYESALDNAGYPRAGILPVRNQAAPPPPPAAPAGAPPAPAGSPAAKSK
ncbi:MAG: glutaredoxin family protein [Betaproteobacteria bacterium]|nr:glutaredoxin family protein [Betaproteobacteria bacterium]